MTQNELKELYNGHVRKPLSYLTNYEWQQYFQIMKSLNKPSIDKKLKRRYCSYNNFGFSDSTYNESMDSHYCNYINDVIKAITKEKIHDYCYYAYQVIDLLKFVPNLQSRLVSDRNGSYIEVWV